MIASSRRPAARLLLSLFLFVALPGLVLAQQKRPLNHNDYDSWRSIQGQQLSRDGKFLSYSLVPQEGEGELVVRNLVTGAEHRQNLGGRASPTEAGDATAAPGEGFTPFRAARAVFTHDNRFLLFSTAPTKAELDAARKAKKKPEEMPRPGLALMDLGNGQVTRIDRVKSFQVPEEAAGYVAYLLEAKPEKPEEKKPDDKKPEEKKLEEKKPEVKKGEEETPDQPARQPGTAPGAGRFGTRSPRGTTPTKVYGTDLVIRSLPGGAERTIADVAEFHWTKDGKTLIYVVSSKAEEKNGIYVLTPGSTAPATPILAGKGKYSRLTWDDKQTCLVFLSDKDDAASTQPRYKLYCWERKPVTTTVASADTGANGAAPAGITAGAALAAELVSTATPGFRSGMVVSENAVLSFSQDGSRLFLGAAPAPPPPPKEEKKDGDTAEPPAEKVVLDLWHWKDDYIQPMQKVRAGQERNRTFRGVYHLKDKKFVQLADAEMPDLLPCPDGHCALGSTDKPYRILVGHDTSYSDYCLVNTADGSRRPILKKQQWGVTWSPGGKYCLYYDGKDWNSLAVEDNIIVNLTKNLGVRFFSEEHDTPSTPFGYGVAGWTKDDKHVLLYDRYDLWQIAPDGSGARNLTGGMGRQQKVQFRLVRLDTQERAIDPSKPQLLRAENEGTRDSGFYRLPADGRPPELLLMQARSFSPPQKAKDADVLVLTASTFNEFPDLLVTTSEFKDLKKVSNANPQKAGLVWGTAELVRFKNADGVPLSGVLVKPENFDPNKKYPLLVYIYERLSQGLHRFVPPSPGTSINVSSYVSNGYLVLMPDIVYTVGYPGQSALKCVLPAIQAVVDKGCVDEKAIGIQGHSWGGYQIAYMVTQTNRFKAAEAGAPVANMVSAYDGIRWGTGLPRQFQYERTQSRIGGSLWQFPMRFVENSPIFMADRVQTPLMMLHNDQDDAVPWYQGIEYYLALRRLGKEVYLFNYNGEFHGLRKRVNQKDYTVRMQQFFDHHLKGAPKPEWMEKGIPYTPREREGSASSGG